MAQKSKITTGTNDRPRNETIGQSGEGLPDDSSTSLEVDETAARMPGKPAQLAEGQANPDEVPPGTPGTGENFCRRCAGTGMIDGRTCPECGGTGKVTTPIGGG